MEILTGDVLLMCHSCQSGVWQSILEYKTLPLSDTNPFNPKCEYILNGMSVSFVSPSVIAASSPEITTSTFVVNSSNKYLFHAMQYNWSNYTDYGWQPMGSILYRCP